MQKKNEQEKDDDEEEEEMKHNTNATTMKMLIRSWNSCSLVFASSLPLSLPPSLSYSF